MKNSIKPFTKQKCSCGIGTESNNKTHIKVLFESAFGFAHDAYYLADNQGRVIAGNKRVKEISGYEIEELVGKSFTEIELLSFKQKLRVVKLIAKDRMGLPVGPEEFVLTRKDGSQIPVEACANILDTKKMGKYMFIMVRDLTERKKVLYKYASLL